MNRRRCYVTPFICLLAVFAACKDKAANNCKQITPQYEGLLQVGKDTFDAKVWQETGYKYQFASIGVNTPLDALLEEMTGVDTDTDSALATLVLYINKPVGSAIASHISVNKREVLAAGLYIKTGKELQYRFYRNDGKIFNLLPVQNRMVKTVSSNFIMEVYKANLPQTDTVSALCFTHPVQPSPLEHKE